MSRSVSRPLDKGAGDIMIFISDVNNNEELIGKKRRLLVRSWSTVSDVKGAISAKLHIPTSIQRLYYKDKELKNIHSLQDGGVCRSGETLTWSIVSQGGSLSMDTTSDCILRCYGDIKCPRHLKHLLLQSKRALFMGLVPSLSLDGTGGAYFLSNPEGRPVTVFKPLDEEPFMENNPRGNTGFSTQSPSSSNNNVGFNDSSPIQMRKGVPPSTSCYREVAAYYLDTDHHAGVPQTTLAECAHSKLCYRDFKIKPKLGSLQEFTSNIGTAEDLSFSKFPIQEVHRIAILDLRILNCDRNSGNILIRETTSSCDDEMSEYPPSDTSKSSKLSLVPIDHGYCLPNSLEIGWCDLCWLDWPQCKEPLSKEMLNYVLNIIDPIKDAELLSKKLNIHDIQCGILVRLSGMLLQHGCKAGLSLYEIANLVVRQDLDNEEKSELEKLHDQALKLSQSTLSTTEQSPSLLSVHSSQDNNKQSGSEADDDDKRKDKFIDKSKDKFIANQGIFWDHVERLLNDLVQNTVNNKKS